MVKKDVCVRIYVWVLIGSCQDTDTSDRGVNPNQTWRSEWHNTMITVGSVIGKCKDLHSMCYNCRVDNIAFSLSNKLVTLWRITPRLIVNSSHHLIWIVVFWYLDNTPTYRRLVPSVKHFVGYLTFFVILILERNPSVKLRHCSGFSRVIPIDLMQNMITFEECLKVLGDHM